MAGMTHACSYSSPVPAAVATSISGTVTISTITSISAAIPVPAAVPAARRMSCIQNGVWQERRSRAGQQGYQRTRCEKPIGTFHLNSSLVAGPAE